MMDADEFKTLFFPLKEKIFNVAFSITGCIEDAEDLTQDIYIRFWENREELSQKESMAAYCMAIAKNSCIDFIRSRRATVGIESAPEAAPTIDTARRIDDKDSLKAVVAVIDTLPVKQKTAIRMHDLAGYSFKEISDAIGEKEENVRKLLSRARQKLRSVFSMTVKD